MRFKKRDIICLGLLAAGLAACQATPEQGTSSGAQDSVTVQPDIHNAQNSLDVAGTYTGTLPCADCPGIDVTVVLKDDSTFQVTNKYQGRGKGKVFNETGHWSFLEDGNTIALQRTDNGSGNPMRYKVGENTLTQLDGDGNVITGPLADRFVLKKKQ
jgi:uncharacterized lipoprotein NlpE involved in copper resistance